MPGIPVLSNQAPSKTDTFCHLASGRSWKGSDAGGSGAAWGVRVGSAGGTHPHLDGHRRACCAPAVFCPTHSGPWEP